MSRKKIILTEEEKETKRVAKNLKGKERYRLKMENMSGAEREEFSNKRKERYINKISLMSPKDKEAKREKDKAKSKEQYIKNKEIILERNRKYSQDHKEEINKKKKERCQNSPLRKLVKTEQSREATRKYYNKNKDEINKKRRNKSRKRREKLLDILGNKCAVCGESYFKFLTIDHINDDGAEQRKKMRKSPSGGDLAKFLERLGWPEEYIKENYQILCWNHNCTKKHRMYFDIPVDQLNRRQRYMRKLWYEAFNFFGPCKECKESDVKYLTIDHIHNDGCERRKNGEKDSTDLLIEFRKQGWPESLKEDYQILCYNHNCSKHLPD